MSYRLLPLCLVAIGAGFLVLSALGQAPPKPARVAPAEPQNGAGTAESGIRVTGTLQPKGGVLHVGGQRGARVAEIKAAEGAKVEAGQVLIVLDLHEQRQREFDMIAMQVSEAADQLAAEKELAAQLIAELKLEREEAERVEPLEIEAQKERIRFLKLSMGQAHTHLKTLKELSNTDTIARNEYARQELMCTHEQSDVKSAEALLEKEQRAHDLHLERLKSKGKKQEIEAARSQSAIPLRSLQKSLELARVRLDDGLVRAPRAGVVLRMSARLGQVLTFEPVVTLGDTSAMEVLARVPAGQWNRLRTGTPASIQVAGLPGGSKDLRGNIASVGYIAERRNDEPSPMLEVTIPLDPTSAPALAEALRHLSNLEVEVTIQAAPPTTAQGG
jgi:ABC exporter DevB family membrane fusion protein